VDVGIADTINTSFLADLFKNQPAWSPAAGAGTL